MLGWSQCQTERRRSHNSIATIAAIDIGKNSFHIVSLDQRRAIVLRQKWSRESKRSQPRCRRA
jgi:hypothetical protein